MKKGLFFLVAALLVVGLPLSALAGTQVFKAKDMEVDYWEICPIDVFPVGPQYAFGKTVIIHYVGTEKFNARVKNGDLGWNRNVHGTAYIYDYDSVGTGEGMVSAMSTLAKVNFSTPTASLQSMYPMSCTPSWITPDVTGVVPLYEGPFQIEEVLQDDGSDFACFNPADPKAVNFQDCYGYGYIADFSKIDYLMYHGKITGNKIYFWKATIHQPGVLQIEDKRGFDAIWTY